MDQQRTVEGDSAFVQCHKRYRKRYKGDIQDDWNELFDFHNPEHLARDTIEQVRLEPDDFDRTLSMKCYANTQTPGFYFFPSSLSEDLQKFLEYQALTLYCKPPYRTNIDVLSKEHQRVGSSGKNNLPSNKLSWATLGYHYNWTSRSYDPDDVSHMPNELQVVAKHFANYIHKVGNKRASQAGGYVSDASFNATACIINYYTTKSVMGGHRDDVEEATNQPVVSLSLGQRPAVFVLGGVSLEDRPVIPMILRPGDVVLLSGESRLRYHSMARLLPCELPVPAMPRESALTLAEIIADDEKWISESMDVETQELCGQYLDGRRINVNLRQVYCHDA